MLFGGHNGPTGAERCPCAGSGAAGKDPPLRQSRRVRISRLPTNPLWRPAPAGAGANQRGSDPAPANQRSLLASLLSTNQRSWQTSAASPRALSQSEPAVAQLANQRRPLPRRHLCGGRQEAGWRRWGGGGGCVRHFRCQVAGAAERSGGRGRAWGCGRRRRPRRPRAMGERGRASRGWGGRSPSRRVRVAGGAGPAELARCRQLGGARPALPGLSGGLGAPCGLGRFSAELLPALRSGSRGLRPARRPLGARGSGHGSLRETPPCSAVPPGLGSLSGVRSALAGPGPAGEHSARVCC